MKKPAFLIVHLSLFSLLFCSNTFAQPEKKDTIAAKKDTVKVGIYVTSIHDIDFKQKEFTISLWLWLKYRNKDFNFMQNLEVPQAKTVEKSFAVQAGREIRIIVDPGSVPDDQTLLLARDVARKIEQEMTYPGQIRVTVIRESRAIELAR